jgi:hypothetical protein
VTTVDLTIELYGIVYNATTASLEPGRRPIARGKAETTEDEIYKSNPQLLRLLRSEFNALVIGYKENKTLHHYLPPQPARIHSFVHQCSPEEVSAFCQSFSFLDILINSKLPVPTDELIAACLRQMSQVHDDPHPFLVAAGKELAILLGGQWNQLKAILERIKSS